MKYVVLDGHTLGAIIGDNIQVLRASVIRGSPYPTSGVVSMPTDSTGRRDERRFRPATRTDFADFMVVLPPDFDQVSVA